MGIGTDGDNLAPELTVSLYTLASRVCWIDSASETAGVQFDTFFVFNQNAKNFIDNIRVIFISIVGVFGRAVAYDIIQMAVDVKLCIAFHVFEDRLKIFAIGFFFAASFIKRSIIRITSVAKVRRTDDKIKFM